MPTKGTITLVFSDIEGSTRLLEDLGDDYATLLADHHRLLKGAVRDQQGVEVDTAGDGLFCTFPTAKGALAAAVAAQRALQEHEWPRGATVRVRMGIHTGEPLSAEARYVGMDVHRAARICAAGHGGQILVSQTARVLVGVDLPGDVNLRDLGEHRLKDLAHPEHLFQVVAPGLQADFPPIRSLDTLPNNLPRQLSSFVGRRQEAEDAKRLLATTSLLTLTGPGGVGKTRLGLQIGADLLESFPDGVWVVELETLSDPALLLGAVTSALRISARPGAQLIDALTEALSAKRALIVLDTCEHLLDAVAQLADQLLRACPDVQIVATSREALGIAGETLYPVPSLSIPDPDHLPALEKLEESDAVRLFLERARAVHSGFGLTEGNARGVAQICQRLDGIPLAVELAAARVRALPPDQIAARLDDRFRLLTGGSRTALPRHRTLRAAMDWSFELLSAEEQVLLRRLSAFAGGWTIEAAEAVCATPPVEAADILDLLARLVDRSLVIPDEQVGEARYRLLDTIREYAQGRLVESGEAAEVHMQHRDWFLRLVEQAGPAFFHGPDPGAWLGRLAAEHDNLRAALAWSHEDAGGADAELRLAAGLWRYWESRGHLVEGRGALERALERTGGELSELRAAALTGAGNLAFKQGDYAGAAAFHEESLVLHRHLGKPSGIAYACNNLANLALELGDYERARALYEECLELTRAAGDQHATAIALINLGDVATRQADYQTARTLHEESIHIFREFGDRWGEAYALGHFARSSSGQGDFPSARAHLNEALAIYRGLGDGRAVARTLVSLGDVAMHEDDREGAASLYRQSLAERRKLGDPAGVATTLERLARVTSATEHRLAATLLGAAEAIRESIRAPLPSADALEYEHHLARIQAAMSEADLRSAWLQGRAMSLEQAVAYAEASPAG